MNVLKPHVSLNVTAIDRSVAKGDAPAMRETASACCAPVGVEAKRERGPGCCG